MRHLRPAELRAYLEHTQPLLLDVREPWEFHICHIAGSQLVPMREIAQQLPTFDPNQEIVIICHRGIRSRRVGYFLESAGFTRIINLAGGLAAWAEEVDLTMSTY
ncbi:MAG: sulfurtransferase [Thiotrichaceae bacterium IS1]|nr:MAG: sulfurtransferase [Thiotrichaceae bacterium IS1]